MPKKGRLPGTVKETSPLKTLLATISIFTVYICDKKVNTIFCMCKTWKCSCITHLLLIAVALRMYVSKNKSVSI